MVLRIFIVTSVRPDMTLPRSGPSGAPDLVVQTGIEGAPVCDAREAVGQRLRGEQGQSGVLIAGHGGGGEIAQDTGDLEEGEKPGVVRVGEVADDGFHRVGMGVVGAGDDGGQRNAPPVREGAEFGGEGCDGGQDIAGQGVRQRGQERALEEALERERIDKEVAQATAAVFERLALQDGLTGLLNRRALDERLAQEVERARRHGHPLTVALGDIDHFKRINDTYGHLGGDEALKAVARLCQATARGGDSVGRYGGEEIALLLPETTAEEGLAVCERLRRAIEDHDWASLAPGLRVTISIGLSDRPDAPHPAALLAAADAHLYQAKQGGRNRTCCAPAPKFRALQQDSDGAA